MKRTLILCAVLGLLIPVGCGETTTEVKKVEEVKTPSGTQKIEDTHKETDTTKKP